MSRFVPEIGDVMTPGAQFVAPYETLADAQRLMNEYGVRHLPVLREDEVVGILSDRDVARATALRSSAPAAITVEEAMTPDPYSVPLQMPLNAVAREMAARKVGAAIVIEQGGIAGIFTTTDALDALADAIEGKDVVHAYESVPAAPPAGSRAGERDLP